MSRIAHFALILFVAFSLPRVATAQENKAAPNISLVQINADGMIADLKYLVLDLAGDKKGWTNLEQLIPTFLEGIDKQRPLAGAARQKCFRKLHTVCRQLIQMRRLDFLMTVGTTIVPRHIIGDEYNEVRLTRRRGLCL